MNLFVKVHERLVGNTASVVVALCDENLLGQTFTQGEACLDLKKYAAFYQGDAVTIEQAERVLLEYSHPAPGRGAANINAVGEAAVAVTQKTLRLQKSGAKRIAKIPHLQVYRV